MSDPGEAVDPDSLGGPEFLAYSVLSVHREEGHGELSRTGYHKLTTIADLKLRSDHGLDIGLQSHWYFYGLTVVEDAFREQIAFTPNANYHSGQAYYPADRVSETDFAHLDPELRRTVRSVVQQIVERHGDKDWRELERYQYRAYAPSEFVERYAMLRGVLYERRKRGARQASLGRFDHSTPDAVVQELDRMLEAFPEDRYELLADEYLLWDDTFRLLADNGAPAEELEAFHERMVEAVSRVYLRFEVRNNVPTEQLHEWAVEARREIEQFRAQVETVRSRALSTHEPEVGLSTVAESYNATIHEEIENLD